MAPAPVQIVWSYDTTGSMSSCLETVKRQVQELSQRLLDDIPGLEIGIVAHGDYCDEGSTYLVKTMPFSNKPSAIAAWVQSVGSTGGGDAPEAYEIALRAGLRDFAWKPEARKVFAMIGDEVPHTPDFPANRDRVDWEEQLAALADLGVRCFGVQCLGNRHAEFFYKALSERTDGMWLPLSDLSVIADVFTAVCLQVSDATAFDRFRAQLQEGGGVANALVPIILRLARRKHLSGSELSELCGLVARLSLDHAKPPTDVSLPVEAVQVLAKCGAGGCCEVELGQHFVNRGAEGASSFEYRFAVPTGAAVFHFEAVLSSGRRILGVCKGKEEARRDYQRAVARGEKAFLMEENDADLFSMQLGNLAPEERVQIVLRYLIELEEVAGAAGNRRLRLPQHVAPRAGGRATSGHMACYPITVTVEADAGSGAVALNTLSHPSRWEQLLATEGAALCGRLTLLPEHGTLNEDLVFDLQAAAPLPALSVDAERCEILNSTVVRVCLRPPAADVPARPQSRRVALLIDASASMQGAPFAAAHEAARSVLSGLNELGADVCCSCFLLRNATQQLCRSASPTEALAVLEAAMGSAVCGGGSNFIAAFETVAARSPRPDAVVLISDGQGPEKPQETFKKAQELHLPLFCLGVGPDPGAELLEGLAFVSQGTCELAPPVTSPESVAELCAAAKRLAADALANPVDLHVCASAGLPEPQQWPTVCRAYPGRRAVCYLRLQSAELPIDAQLTINGMAVDLQHGVAGQGLHRLGAKLCIQELERLAPAGFEETVKALAVEQGITSSQTSFVAVEEKPEEVLPREENPPVPRLLEVSHPPVPRLLEVSEDASASYCSTPALEEEEAVACWGDVSACMLPMAEDLACPPGALCSSVEAMPCAAVARCSSLGGDISHAYFPTSFDVRTCRRVEEPLCEHEGKIKDMAVLCHVEKALGHESKRKRAAAAVVHVASAMCRAGAAALSSMKLLTIPAPSHDPPRALPPLVPLPGGSACYEGLIEHVQLGNEEHPALLLVQHRVSDTHFVGALVVAGRVEQATITLSGSGERVEVVITCFDEKVVLQGFLDTATGFLEGGIGGVFKLSPATARVELRDTDGDRLVFQRWREGVALYCNGELDLPCMKELKVDRSTGRCVDATGSFTIPEDHRDRVLAELEVLLLGTGAVISPLAA